ARRRGGAGGAPRPRRGRLARPPAPTHDALAGAAAERIRGAAHPRARAGARVPLVVVGTEDVVLVDVAGREQIFVGVVDVAAQTEIELLVVAHRAVVLVVEERRHRPR